MQSQEMTNQLLDLTHKACISTLENLDKLDDLLFKSCDEIETEDAKAFTRALAPQIEELNIRIEEMRALSKQKVRQVRAKSKAAGCGRGR